MISTAWIGPLARAEQRGSAGEEVPRGRAWCNGWAYEMGRGAFCLPTRIYGELAPLGTVTTECAGLRPRL